MSTLLNDYITSSNNSINENVHNTQKMRTSKIHRLKQILKPVLALIKNKKSKKSARKNTYRKSAQPEEPPLTDYFYDSAYESDQNDANELLERQIIDEIDRCEDGAAVPVHTQDRIDIVPVRKGHHYIPVHFARTDAGTFFWTTITSADSDICPVGDKFAISQGQYPEEQVPCDRWAQA